MADKYIKQVSGTLTEQEALTTSAGAGDAGKVAALDGTGRWDESLLPVGIGADTASVVASENLSAGDYVNIWSDGGLFKARSADATTAGKEAHGFVLAGFLATETATVYFEGINTQVSGQTPGNVFLSTTAGVGSATAPSGSGNVVQRLGVAISATSMNFEAQQSIVLA